MDIALLILRLLLTATFLVAGLAKLLDVAGSQQTLRNFGVPVRLAGPSGVLLPLAELAVAVALLPSTSAWWGAVGALLLLLVFVAGISSNLAHGHTPDCHCFGQLYSAPAGWSTLIRNVMLSLVAGFVVWFGRDNAGLSALSWISALMVAQRLELLGFLVVLALLCGAGWLLWHILRQQGRLLLRIEATEARLAEVGLAPLGDQVGRSVAGLAVGTQTPGFRLSDLDGTIGSPLAPVADVMQGLVGAATGQPMRNSVPMAAAASHNNGTGATAVPETPAGPRIGDAAPDFSLPDLSGNLVHLSDFRGRQTLVLFWSPCCGFCQRMLPYLLAWEAQPPEEAPSLLVVSTDSVQDNQAMGLRSPVVLEQAGRSIGSRFGATGTPMAVLVDAEGRIASELAAGAPAILALATTQPTEAEGSIELTIGMATYNDFDGVYFTLQALRLYQDLEHTELLVIDNYGCQDTQNLVEEWLGARYIRATDAVGTAAPRDLIFREARGNAVLCCDCHVLFPPGVIARLKQFYREHPECQDLLQGPLLYDDGKLLATHFDPVWREQMWGTWGTDPRGLDPSGEPFEISMQGLGVFSCLKRAWLGFHPEFRGFGGEEGYIHEKFRQAGRQCLCLPWFRWMHRFSRPSGVKYPLIVEDKLRNYVIGHAELGLDLAPVLRHFSECLPQDRVIALAEQALGGRWTGSAFICEEEPVHRERDGRHTQEREGAKALL